jgi:signal transduction histidine kinase
MEKKMRTKYFSLKEVRLSIAHMVLWSLLTIAFFTYIFIEIGNKIERSPLYLVVIVTIYMLIVVVLTMFFSHRFLGPFERLKTQMRIIQSGDHKKRLTVRSHDDIYIRSFIEEVNRLIDALEESHSFKEEFREKLYSELSTIKNLAEQSEGSKDELKQSILSFYERIDRRFKAERVS